MLILHHKNSVNMILPPKLKIGDTVAIVSTARKITMDEIKPAIALMESWGLNVEVGKTIGAAENQFAGSEAFRVSELQQMLDNPAIKAIWCARGGYGSVQLIDRLDWSAFKKYPKWIVGYSDVTVFHSQLHNLGFETIHAPMPIDISGQSEAAVLCLKRALFGENYTINYDSRDSRSRQGIGKGQLVGGNLSVLYSLCGSASSIDTRGKILFLEDLDEYLYHLDRMMQNLKRNGMLEGLAGLIVGGMNAMRDNTQAFGFKTDNPYGKTANEIIADAVSAYDFPVSFDFPAGHHNDNRALIFGRKIKLKVGEQVEIYF